MLQPHGHPAAKPPMWMLHHVLYQSRAMVNWWGSRHISWCEGAARHGFNQLEQSISFYTANPARLHKYRNAILCNGFSAV